MKAILLFVVFFVHVLNLVTATQLIYAGLSEADKYNIVHTHNKYRALVANGKVLSQPSAENMQALEWDEELARVAQDWANNCEYKHNSGRHVSRFYVGENIAEVRSKGEMPAGDFTQRMVDLWFNEYKLYKFGQKMSPKIGHYTQWVWAETNRVGCGFSYYFNEREQKYHKYYVCNYGTAGNVQDELPYVTGKPLCHRYGLKFSHKYPGLCTY